MRDFPKFGENLQGKREMCMYHTLAKCMNPNCSLYHAQAKEMYAKYAANICTVLAPEMNHIWRHGTTDIRVMYPVGIKLKREG